MKLLFSLSTFLITFFLTITGVQAQKKSTDIVGFWLNEDGDAKIEVFNKGGKYFGKLVWLKTPIDTDTKKAKLDKHNPVASLRTRPLLSLEILTGFVFDGDDEWNDGKIYDPKTGKTYSCLIKFESADKLKIRGYIGVSWVGKTTMWTRATAP
ncbi:MAG: DUF2147 domain-containing protein [Bacteroidetes bacterium HGW-Bacteroidetes-22]|nr:MAG: DUF2147 domain-containing protein [Bacteroidetes bacterium HGW-Bacteroidetes-22]